jgi:hypothetical protein
MDGGVRVKPGGPAVCDGHVFHRRLTPKVHEFAYPVSYVWLDPDAPRDLCRHHPLWSASHVAPVHFRSRDYGDRSSVSLGDQVRNTLRPVVGRQQEERPDLQIRMLTQVRRWGWLFNPITLYVAWDADGEAPVAAVLEVTNTPWKERHQYAVALVATGCAGDTMRFDARVRKVLHVSPFLDEEFDYVIGLSSDVEDTALAITIDVVRPGTDEAVLTTRMELAREPASLRSLGTALRRRVAPTHRVSAAIHSQAARLWLMRVPFVAHPRKRKVPSWQAQR